MKTRLLLLIILASFLTGAAPAQAGWLEFLFPTLRNRGPDPGETLQAPFAYDPTRPAEAPAAVMSTNLVPLDQPHTNPGELGEWLTDTVSELMTLAPQDPADDFAKNAHYFSDAGKGQYKEFLSQNKILETLSSGNFRITSVVSDPPALLNQGVVDGRYRWLYEVPVMTTYLGSDTRSYKNIKPVSRDFFLIIQVGRMKEAAANQSVVIERWTEKIKTAAKN